MPTSNKIKTITKYFNKLFPNPKCELHYQTDWQLLVATMLSAQCTDRQVNLVTPKLFERYSSISDFAKAEPAKLETLIYSTGFYRNKTKNIIMAAKLLMKEYHGILPKNMIELLKLPGVARKTANVLLGEFYHIQEGIAVDTHVKRISGHLQLSKEQRPEKIEKDLMQIFPKVTWTKISHQIILFGRKICSAKRPNCQICELKKFCQYYQNKKVIME